MRHAPCVSVPIQMFKILTPSSSQNFAAEMECAYINGHQARFLLAADRQGNAAVQASTSGVGSKH